MLLCYQLLCYIVKLLIFQSYANSFAMVVCCCVGLLWAAFVVTYNCALIWFSVALIIAVVTLVAVVL